MVESHTENLRVCLFIIDGAKGLRKGIHNVFGKQALVQRCQWHKRENVIAYLPKSQQGIFRKKLQKAYRQKSYKQVKQELASIRKELNLLNQWSIASIKAWKRH